MILVPIADEGASPEVDQDPVLLRLDMMADILIPVLYGSSLK